MSVTLFAVATVNTEKKLPTNTVTKTSKKLHTLDVVRLKRTKIAKIKDVKEKVDNKVVFAKTSKKLHTLDVVRLKRSKISKIRDIKTVVKHKELFVKASKKLHTLDSARLKRTKIAKIREIKKIDTSKIVRVKTSKKLHTLKLVNLQQPEVKKVAKRRDIKKVNSPKLLLAKTSKKVHSSKIVKLKKISKKKIYTVKKNKDKQVKLARMIKYHAKPITLAKTQKRVTLSDIFFKSSRSMRTLRNSKAGKATSIINIAKTKLGRKYVWGAIGERGTFDCSGFTSYVYKKNGIHIPRTSRNQAKYGKYISRNNLKKGDLIFFDTSKRRKGYVNHVGIYLGNGKFIHASSAKKKVVVSSLSKFYAQRYVGARRPS